MIKRSYVKLAAAACLGLSVYGNAGADKRMELDEVVVVSAPVISENQPDRYGSSATIVTEQQIRDLNAQDIATSLRRTPGVNISRYNPTGSHGGAEGGGIFIRGMGSSRPGAEIKTFIDGVPMYMSVWNHPLLDLLSIDTASAIEIYKSPQPKKFGNAFALVNIVPKRKLRDGFRTELRLAAGSYKTFIQAAEHAGRSGAFDYYLGQSFRVSDGHREKSDGQLANYFLRIGWELSENWYAYVFGLHTDNYTWDPGVKGGDPIARQGKYATEAWLGAMTVEHRHDNAAGRYQIYANQGKGRQLKRPDGTPDATWEFKYRGFKAGETWEPWSGGEIKFGTDYDEIRGNGGTEGNRFEGETHRITSPYIAVSHMVGEPESMHLVPSAGTRFYNHNRFGSEYSPHAGLVLGHGNTKLRLGYARGVIYPGLDVMIISEYVNPALGDSWKNLDAETLNHYEIGISHVWNRLSADLTLFRDEGRNRYVIVPPPPPTPVFENTGDYRTHGAETTITCKPTDNLSFFMGLTLLDKDPDNLPYAPATSFSAGVNWRFMRNFMLSLDCQRVGSIYTGPRARRDGAGNENKVDSYYLVNGKLSYALPLEKWNMQGEIFVAGENLADVDYEYRPGYPMPGINGMAGIRIAL